jgi:hypothetical protein
MKFNDCKFCGKNTGKKYNLYCNTTCQNAWQNQEKVRRWLDGWNPSNYELPKPIRTYLLEEAGYRCTDTNCAVPGGFQGVNRKSGKTVLTIDHVDGNASNDLKSNLRVLCPNCHAMTETFGGLNKGNGRSQRYA